MSLDPDKNFEIKGKWKRGAQTNPTNRFESFSTEADFSDFAENTELLSPSAGVATQFFKDNSKSILTKNNSPDIGFQFSVNPYRGCEHGCSYCYARPTHETLGMNAGLDFESKIMVKAEAPSLLRQALSKKSWQPEVIAFSGVTDCYQPAERRFRLTQGCLKVLLEFRNPAVIITKNALVQRDVDLLAEMAKHNLIKVYVSVTTLDPNLATKMEPRTSLPEARLKTISALSERQIPVGVLMAPMIPGLNDMEAAALLEACATAGAKSASYVMLRLPLNVRPIFLSWLEEHFPEKVSRVTALIKEIRGGELNDANFGSRMRGQGQYAQMISTTFKMFAKRYGLDRPSDDLDCSKFRIPGKPVQRLLFAEEE